MADGADLKPGFVFDGSGELEFVNTATGGPANVADPAAEIALRHVADDGSVRTVQGRVFHTADNDPDRLENNLNPGGAERVVSGIDPTSGALLLGFEDARDFDFNDVVIGLGPIVVPPPVLVPPASLADLDGSNGFRLDGINAGDRSGVSVASAGDVNGDGFEDVIIGAYLADGGAGERYVVFGRASGFGATFDLATLDGTNGFRLDGINQSGFSVAGAGDINGDGFGDLIIGAFTPGGLEEESHVVFGRASGFAAGLDLATLDGANGFLLVGIDQDDRSGFSVAGAGDINGDGSAILSSVLLWQIPAARATSCSAEPRVLVPASTSRTSTARTAFASTASMKAFLAAARSPGPGTSTATASRMSSSALVTPILGG